jgi:hypothetical protein
LIAQRDEIALLDTRLGELLGRLDTTETSAAWVRANAAYRDMRGASSAERVRAEVALGDLLEQGLADTAAWAEMASLMEQRRKCSETEQKRMAQLEQFVTVKQANVLMGALLQLVTDNVPDVDARRRIATGLYRLADTEPTPATRPN